MNKKIQDISQKIKGSLFNYPLVLMMSLTMASTIAFMVETSWKLQENFLPMRIIITSGLGISLLFSIKMLSQRIGRELLWNVLGILFLIGYFFILPEKQKDFTVVHAFIIFPSIILSHLSVACIAFLGKNSETQFWQFNKNLFVNFFLTLIFTGVLTGGVLLAILAVQQLFGFKFHDTTYGETFAMLSVFGSTLIFLLFSEKGLEDLEKDGDYPVILKFFTQFILIPLLLIYVVILYFYSAKILLSWQLPEGWVSYLILAYSIVGILALLLVHPLKGGPAKSWVKIFSSLFYFSLLPLIILLFTAIFTRVLEYGFTEARYYVLLLAVWLLSVVLYFIFIKKSSIKFIPISLFALGLFSLTFPYFNTFSVAKRSQKNELEMLLSKYNLLENGKINFARKITADAAYNISDKFIFLSNRFEYDYLNRFLTKKDKKSFILSKTWDIESLFKNVSEEDKLLKIKTLQLSNNLLYYKVNDYEYLIPQDNLLGDGIKLGEDHLTLINEMDKEKLLFKLKLNSVEEVDLAPLINALFNKQTIIDGEVKTDNLFIESNIGNYHVKVVFGEISRTTENKAVNYYFSNASFLIRKN